MTIPDHHQRREDHRGVERGSGGVRRLRWWLARKIAPTAIVEWGENPTGAWIVIRQGDVVARYAVDQMRITHRNSIWRKKYGERGQCWDGARGRTGRFVGTLR